MRVYLSESIFSSQRSSIDATLLHHIDTRPCECNNTLNMQPLASIVHGRKNYAGSYVFIVP